MEIKTRYLIYGIIIGIFLMLILYSYLYFMDYNAINIFQLKDKCNAMLKQTCSIANAIINLTEKQSQMLEKCCNISEYTFPRLSKLNCDLLVWNGKREGEKIIKMEIKESICMGITIVLSYIFWLNEEKKNDNF